MATSRKRKARRISKPRSLSAAELTAHAQHTGRVLDSLSDHHFIKWTRYIVTGIGGMYLVQAARLMLG